MKERKLYSVLIKCYILNIQVSMNNNEKVLIGQGKVSKVYLIEGAAYKCFPTSYPLSWIKYEVTIQNEIVSKTKLPILSYDYVNNSREIKNALHQRC